MMFFVFALVALASSADLGKPAPDFSLPGADGKVVKLSSFKGKRVVLEWFNPDCPFVRFAHTKGPLRGPRSARSGVVWLAINSGAPGKQGAGRERNVAAIKEYELNHPLLLDEDGAVGRAYGAKSTPHVFVIDEHGILVYRGGVDNAPLGEAEGPAQNYVESALKDLEEGRKVAKPETRAYGCSVKYGS